MSKRAAILAAEIEPGMLVWVSHATPASVLVSEVKHIRRGQNKGQTLVRRGSHRAWIWLDSDKTYPLVKERSQ